MIGGFVSNDAAEEPHTVIPRAKRRWLPGLVLPVIGAVCVMIAALVVHVATRHPSLGLSLEPHPDGHGVVISSVRSGGPADTAGLKAGWRLIGLAPAPFADGRPGPVVLEPRDVMEEPDTLPSYEAMASFMDGQNRLFRILRQPTVTLLAADDRSLARQFVVAPEARPISSLPLVFWVQLVSGLSSVVIAGWILTLSRRRLAAGLFVLSGLGMALSALSAAIYSTRELAIPGDLFQALSALNHIGALTFGAAMIALFAVYPRRLVPAGVPIAVGAVTGLVILLDVTALGPSPLFGIHLPALMQMAIIIGFIIAQWRASRGEPANRAAMRWMGLSVVLGCSVFLGGVALPMVLDQRQILTQGYTFAFFAMIYGGIALGIRRYRLFDLGTWSFRILFYAGGGILLLAVDVSLVWLLHVERAPALGLSLLLVGFLYLPIRDALARYFLARNVLEPHELFAVSLNVAFAPNLAERGKRWHGLLSELFGAAEIAPLPDAVGEPAIDGEGLALSVPAIIGSPPLRLVYRSQGQALFTPADAQLVRQLLSLVEQADDGRLAYERGVARERKRIAQDLHDDVGARLLSGLHTVDGQTQSILKAAISDIRAIVSGLEGERIVLARALAEMRHEAGHRLEAAGISLDWPLLDERAENIAADLTLDYSQSKALMSAVREVISNVIRHSGATRVRSTVRLQSPGGLHHLRIEIADDGQGLGPPSQRHSGFGMKNIGQRIAEIGGEFAVSNGSPGTHVALELVLAAGSGASRDTSEGREADAGVAGSPATPKTTEAAALPADIHRA
jgi:two-component system sensor histidine kinase DevS